MDLMEASKQWAQRPTDERYSSLKELLFATSALRESSHEIPDVELSKMRVESREGELSVLSTNKENPIPVRISHVAMGQLCQRIGAPADYLRGLAPTLTAQNLNFGLANGKQQGCKLLLHKSSQTGGWLLRAITGPDYSRIWHDSLVRQLIELQEAVQAGGGGLWRVPPARPFPELAEKITQDEEGNEQLPPGVRRATQEDVLNDSWSLSISVGDLIADAGLYLGQGVPELFVFMVNEDARINDGSEAGLSRGFFLTNNEAQYGAWKIKRFLYRHVCGNHIVWDASKVEEIRIIHRGKSADANALDQLSVQIKKYSEEEAGETEEKIKSCQEFVIEADKEKVIDKLFGLDVATRRFLGLAWDAVDPEIDGAANTAWGFAQGVTRVSQSSEFADKRLGLDLVAAKVLEMPF